MLGGLAGEGAADDLFDGHVGGEVLGDGFDFGGGGIGRLAEGLQREGGVA